MCADKDIAIRQKVVLMTQKIHVAGHDKEPLEEQSSSDYEADPELSTLHKITGRID